MGAIRKKHFIFPARLVCFFALVGFFLFVALHWTVGGSRGTRIVRRRPLPGVFFLARPKVMMPVVAGGGGADLRRGGLRCGLGGPEQPSSDLARGPGPRAVVRGPAPECDLPDPPGPRAIFRPRRRRPFPTDAPRHRRANHSLLHALLAVRRGRSFPHRRCLRTTNGRTRVSEAAISPIAHAGGRSRRLAQTEPGRAFVLSF